MKKKMNFGKIDFEGCGSACNSVVVEMEYKTEGEKKIFLFLLRYGTGDTLTL